MAAVAGRSVLRYASYLRTASSKISGSARPAFGLPKPRPASAPTAARILRSPVEMSFCVDSLLPLHSATASATMTSMLSVTGGFSGWLPLLRSIS